MPDTAEDMHNEEQIGEYDKLLSTLSEPEEHACVCIAVIDTTGLGLTSDILHDASHIEDSTLDSLVDKDILESKPSWEFLQEFADKYRETVEAIRKRVPLGNLHTSKNHQCSNSERKLLLMYPTPWDIARSKSTPLSYSYRLKDTDFAEYLRKLAKEEDEESTTSES